MTVAEIRSHIGGHSQIGSAAFDHIRPFDGKIVGTFDDQHVDYPPGHTPGAPLYNGKSSGLVGAFTEFGFGFHDWHPNQPFDIFYDDIVLDTKRVNCLP